MAVISCDSSEMLAGKFLKILINIVSCFLLSMPTPGKRRFLSVQNTLSLAARVSWSGERLAPRHSGRGGPWRLRAGPGVLGELPLEAGKERDSQCSSGVSCRFIRTSDLPRFSQ